MAVQNLIYYFDSFPMKYGLVMISCLKFHFYNVHVNISSVLCRPLMLHNNIFLLCQLSDTSYSVILYDPY